MKNIDPKSLIIGVLATALVFACTDSGNQSSTPSLVNKANAATGVNDKWDDKQEWLTVANFTLTKVGLRQRVEFIGKPTKNNPSGKETAYKVTGWEPFGSENGATLYRKRIK